MKCISKFRFSRKSNSKDVKPFRWIFNGQIRNWCSVLLRALLVRGIILQTRPKNQLLLTQKWWDEGSPLVVISKRMHEKVQNSLMYQYHLRCVKSFLAFRLQVHDKAWPKCCFPLYPQHAMASTTTILELAEHRKKYSRNEIYYCSCFYNKPWLYKTLLILSRTFRRFDYDHLLFSYHGIPGVTFAKQILPSHIVK
jgi:ferrochelatase